MAGNMVPKLALAGLSLALLAFVALRNAVDIDSVAAAPGGGSPRASRALPSAAPVVADEAIAAILERPLFERSRRPPAPPAAPVEATAPPTSEPPLPSRLAGVMITPFDAEALFAQDGRLVPVHCGDTINGWTVSIIEAERVVLTSEFGERVLEPKAMTTLRTVIAGMPRPLAAVPPQALSSQLAAVLQGRPRLPASTPGAASTAISPATSPTVNKAAAATAPHARGRRAAQ